jgi:phage gp36-like protein
MLLTAEDMVVIFGEEEMLQIAGTGPRDERSLDQPRIDEAVGSAVAMVTGYVASRYPQVTETPMLKGFAADIARYRLRGKGGQQTAMSETVQKRYDDAIARLKDIAAGKLALDVALDGSGAAIEAVTSEFNVLSSIPAARAGRILEGY